MRINNITAYISTCILTLLMLPALSFASELTIRDGSTLTVGADSTLFLDCAKVTIETGGTFLVSGGTVNKRGVLKRDAGATYTVASGSVGTCYNPAINSLLLLQ